jgi:TRAP-type C4-dicarboxylate transport system permease small subunit
MSHGFEVRPDVASLHQVKPLSFRCGWLNCLSAMQSRLNRWVVVLSMLALVVACLILTAGMLMRYFFQSPTDWQDELCVFLLVGSVFLTAAAVQSQRGHIGIDAITGWLSPQANRWRLWMTDVLSLAFCSFFCWKSLTLLWEAWDEGMTTSSTWASPLWIPYGLMSLGMVLLVLQLALQVLSPPVQEDSHD